MSDKDQPPKAVRINSWGFETDTAGGRRSVPLFGIFLIVFGMLLAAGQVFLALGIILLLIWLRDRSNLALYIGVFVTALALSDLLNGAGVVHGNGWGTLFLGVGVLLIALVRIRSGKSWAWAAILGALLCLSGGSGVATSYLNVDVDRLVWPVVLVLLGAWILFRSRRN
jgi:hypothetical protein